MKTNELRIGNYVLDNLGGILKIKSYEKNVICSILSFSNDCLNILACLLYSILKNK